jgi:hypothetical protein
MEKAGRWKSKRKSTRRKKAKAGRGRSKERKG